MAYGYTYPDYIYFGNMHNCDIDLSFFDFDDEKIAKRRTISNYTEIRFTNCTNINITDLPFCDPNSGHYIHLELWGTSLSGITNNTYNTTLSNMCEDGKQLVITDLDIFKHCYFKNVKLTENYFKTKHPEEYNEGITELPDHKYVKNCFNEEIDKFVNDCIIYSTSDFTASKNSRVDVLTKYSFKNLRKSNNKNYKYMLV